MTTPDETSASTTLIETADDVGSAQRVAVNVYETEGAIVVVAPMPGVMADDVEISLEGRTLSVRAELRTDAPKHYLVHEWDYGRYERTIELPPGVDGEVTASLGNGQLAVSIRREGSRTGERTLLKPAGPGPASG